MKPKDYCKLKGRTKELNYTQREVAEHIGITESTYSQKLNGLPFRQSEIEDICDLLCIIPDDIGKYFFANKV